MIGSLFAFMVIQLILDLCFIIYLVRLSRVVEILMDNNPGFFCAKILAAAREKRNKEKKNDR